MLRISNLLTWSVLCFGLLVWFSGCETTAPKPEEPSVAATSQKEETAAKRTRQSPGRQSIMAEGRSAQLIADYPKALEEYQEGLKRAQASGNKKAIANFLSRIGTVHRDLGDYDKAMEHLELALAIRRELGDRHGEGWDLARISSIYQHLGDYDKAFQVCEQALAIARETHDRMGEGNALTSLGYLYRQIGQNQKALEYYNQALPLDQGDQQPCG